MSRPWLSTDLVPERIEAKGENGDYRLMRIDDDF
ncbi:hypothetical protein ACVIN2_006791 [Bradyrhizobium sp. USDA 3650]